MINKKLEQLVMDLNEKEDIFLENPLVYTTSGFCNSIEFNGESIYSHEGYQDWQEFLDNIRNIKYLYERLAILTRDFFENMTNEEIEEKYGIGIERKTRDAKNS